MIRSSIIALADQAVWALTNFVAVLLAAHALSRAEFGLFGVALSLILLSSGLGIAMSGEAFGVARGRLLRNDPAVDAPGRDPAMSLAAQRARAMGVIWVFAAISPVVVGLGIYWGMSAAGGPVVWLVAAAAPFAVLAEGSRSLAYAERRALRAVRISSSWAAVQLVTTAVLWILAGELTGAVALGGWLGGAAASALVGVGSDYIRPSFRDAAVSEWKRRGSFGFEYLATAGATQLTVLLTAGVAGLVATGALRALQTVFGPLNIVIMGIRNAIVPAAAQELTGTALRRAGAAVGAVAVCVTVAVALAFLLIPLLGRLLMGDNWPEDPGMLAAFALGRAVVGGVVGALVVLRALDHTTASTRLRAASAVALVVPFAVMIPRSLEAALWASSSASAGVAVCWWVAAARLTGRRRDRAG